MKTIALLQSNYIPWKGYFDLIRSVDNFIIYDQVQYTRRDWRNRNLIKTKHGLKWLTIPVIVKGRYSQSIKETKVFSGHWAFKHWTSIKYNYSKAKYFPVFEELFYNAYQKSSKIVFLSEINLMFIELLNEILHIDTKISYSDEYQTDGDRNGNILSICNQLSATDYLTGPSAKNYIDEKLFQDSNINIRYFEYSGYPHYNQLFPPFIHNVSVLDLIFNEGESARDLF